MASEENDLAARVRVLEQQVAALQEDRPNPVGQGEPVPDPEKFWALRELKTRSPDTGAVLFTGSVRTPEDEPVEWQQCASTDTLLAQDWSEFADTLAALGQPVRLTLLHAVLGGTRTVAELGTLEGVGTSGQLYHHLRQLVSAGWLRTAGRGRYEVPATRTVPLLAILSAAQR